jgi:iron(III) transport system permease protein
VTATTTDASPDLRGPEPGWFSRRMARLRNVQARTVAILAIVAVLVWLVVGPVTMLVFSSFRATEGQLPFGEGVEWTLGNYVAVLTNPATYTVMGNTFLFAAGALVISFALSITLAWLIERTDMPLRGLVFVVIIASIGLPNVIAGIAYALLLNPSNGLLNIALRALFGMDPDASGPLNAYSLAGMIFVQGITLVPITYLLVAAGFRAMDTAMEDAAATSGAPYRTVMRRITLPLLTPVLLAALVYQFVTVIESFDIPLVLGLRGGVPVLSTTVFVETQPSGGLPNYGLASSYAILLLFVAVGPLFIYNRVLGRGDRYATITGHSYLPRRIRLGAWKIPALALALSFIVISFVLPALVMLWTSLQPFYAVPSAESISRISLDAYAEVLGSGRLQRALVNTIILGVATGLGAMLVGLLVSWILVRTRSRMRYALDVLAFTPHAMPGVLIGLSVLLIYLVLPLPVYGTIWIIVIALATQYISISTRLMGGGISQIRMELEEAGAVSGAAWGAVIRRIVLPLVLPAFLNGFLLVFLLAIKNLTLALILFTPESIVMSTLVWNYWDIGADTAETAVVGMFMVGITLVLSVIVRRLNRETAQLT